MRYFVWWKVCIYVIRQIRHAANLIRTLWSMLASCKVGILRFRKTCLKIINPHQISWWCLISPCDLSEYSWWWPLLSSASAHHSITPSLITPSSWIFLVSSRGQAVSGVWCRDKIRIRWYLDTGYRTQGWVNTGPVKITSWFCDITNIIKDQGQRLKISNH